MLLFTAAASHFLHFNSSSRASHRSPSHAGLETGRQGPGNSWSLGSVPQFASGGDCYLLLGESGHEEVRGTAPESFSRLLQSPAVCLEDIDSSANTCLKVKDAACGMRSVHIVINCKRLSLLKCKCSQIFHRTSNLN